MRSYDQVHTFVCVLVTNLARASYTGKRGKLVKRNYDYFDGFFLRNALAETTAGLGDDYLREPRCISREGVSLPAGD